MMAIIFIHSGTLNTRTGADIVYTWFTGSFLRRDLFQLKSKPSHSLRPLKRSMRWQWTRSRAKGWYKRSEERNEGAFRFLAGSARKSPLFGAQDRNRCSRSEQGVHSTVGVEGLLFASPTMDYCWYFAVKRWTLVLQLCGSK